MDHWFKTLMSIGLLLFCIAPAFAQTTVEGVVLDFDTDEPIPFCNVYMKSSITTGVTADIDGKFSLTYTSELANDTLVVSYIGYEAEERILTTGTDQHFRVHLKSGFTFDVVEIKAGENPANEIVRNIIANRKHNDQRKLATYSAEAYSKVELDLSEIPNEMRDSKMFKDFQFIFDNVDSTSDVLPFLPAYLSEEVADIHYLRSTGEEKEILKARQVSGIKNHSLTDFIHKVHQKENIYNNWMTLLDKSFVSPFSNVGLQYYEYYIMDSTTLKGKWSYKLKYKPRHKQENTFYGDFWVDMDSYAIQMVHLRMNPEVNINLINRIIMYYEFEEFEGKWVPIKEKTILDFKVRKNSPGIIGRKTISYKDYSFELPFTNVEFEKLEPESFRQKELAQPDEFWKEARHEKLTNNEAAVYSMIDSIKNVPIFKTYADVLTTLATGFKTLGPIEIGPYTSVYSKNIVQGHRVSLGIGTSKKLTKKWRAYGYGAYGFKNKRFNYGGEFIYTLNKKPRTNFGFSFMNDVNVSGANTKELGEDNFLSGVYRRKIPQKLLHQKEMEIFFQKGWYRGWSNRLTLLHQKVDPYGKEGFPFYFQPQYETNPSRIDSNFTSAQIAFTLRYAYKERTVGGAFKQMSLGSKYPIVELKYTSGIKGIVKSSLNFHRLDFRLAHWFYIQPLGWIKYQVKAGKVFGKLPFLFLESHRGNETYFFNRWAFNGMNNYEFVSDTYASIMVEHHWGGFFFNKIPLIRKLKWRVVTGAKAVYGTLSDKNKTANSLNFYDRSYKDFRKKPINGEGVYYGTFDEGPYLEASAGIENIFTFFRVDAFWRLNYLNNRYAIPFTVRGTFSFYF